MDTLNLDHITVRVVYPHTTSCILIHLNHTHNPLWYAYLKSTIGPFWATWPRSGSANSKLRLRFFPIYFSWISVKMKMASVVPRPGVKQNHMSSTFTTLGVLIFASQKKMHFAGINFHELKKFKIFASINFRELVIFRIFAIINFRGCRLFN